MNLFQLAPNDKSIDYLAAIFGTMNGVLTQDAGPAGSLSLLGTMFRTFNSIVLVIGVLIVVYITVVGVLATAQEGEFLGKKWNSLWVPLRVVLGIAALVPTGSGYSTLQIVMMWVIVQGIGAADVLWTTALKYIDVAGSPYAQVTIPGPGAQNAIAGIYSGLVCDITAKQAGTDPASLKRGGYYCNNSGSQFCKQGAIPAFDPNTSATTMLFGPEGSCGKINFCDLAKECGSQRGGSANSIKCAACQGQRLALQKVFQLLGAIAAEQVAADTSYRDFYYNSSTVANKADWAWIYDYCRAKNPPIPQSQCCIATRAPFQICKAPVGKSGNPNFPSPNAQGEPQNPSDEAVINLYWAQRIKQLVGGSDFIQTSVNMYLQTVTKAVTDYITAQALTNPQELSGKLKDAQETGWIFAGSYYYTIAQMNDNNLQSAIPTLSGEAVGTTQTTMNNYRNNFNAANVLMSEAAGSGGMFSSTPAMKQLNGVFGSANDTTAKAFSTSTSGGSGSNPLSQLQITGTVLLVTAQITAVVFIAVTFALGIVGAIAAFVLGTGIHNPVTPAMTLIYMLVVPIMFMLVGFMISVGGLLGVYVPLIPYVIFTFGALGWMTSCIEAMVAGPLVALGILSPSAQHEVLGKAEPALMLLFSIFLRPSLMIFGLMAAMLLATVFVDMVNYAFWTTVVSGFAEEGDAGVLIYNPLQMILFLCAYVMLIVTGLNKCFAAIYLIPQGVMGWIGGQAAQYGESESLGGVKGGVEAGMGGAKQTGETGKEVSKGTMEPAGQLGGAGRAKTEKEAKEARANLKMKQMQDKEKGGGGES